MNFKLFSFFSDLTSAFLTYPPGKRPMAPIAQSKDTVFQIIENSEFKNEVATVLENFIKYLINQTEFKKEDSLKQLQRCRVVKVQHYRDTKSSIPHETIILTIEYRHPEGIDLRFLSLESLRETYSSETNIPGATVSKSWLAKGATANSHYSYVIHSDLREVLDPSNIYKLVQSFTLPYQGGPKFDVLDAVILATTINSAAEGYTTAHYMCMWWAAIFFVTAAKSCGITEFKKGPTYQQAGSWKNVQLVTKEGNLSLRDPVLLKNLFSALSDLPEGDKDKARAGVDEDSSRLSKQSKKVTAKEVEDVFEVKRHKIIDEVMKPNEETLKAKEDIRKANEESRKDKMVIQKQAEELARHKAEAAARDAEVARLVAQLASVHKSPTA